MKYAAILVILSAKGCLLESLDRAEPQHIPLKSFEECKKHADALDQTRNTRAFCIDTDAVFETPSQVMEKDHD